MDRRVFLAVILTAVVIVVTPLLFPGSTRPPVADSIAADSMARKTAATDTMARTVAAAVARDTAPAAQPKPTAPGAGDSAQIASSGPADSIAAKSRHMIAWYSSAGGSPLAVELTDYAAREPTRPEGPVVLKSPSNQPLIQYAIQSGNTTTALTTTRFAAREQSLGGHEVIDYTGTVNAHAVRVVYTSPGSDADRYLVHVSVEYDSAPPNTSLRIELPSALTSMESDTLDDIRHLAYGYRAANGDVTSLPFAKLDSGVTKAVPGPLGWAAIRNKYFLVAVFAPDSGIDGANFTGEPRVNKIATTAAGAVAVPLKGGRASFDLYMGPQEFERLRALGHGLDQVNPYAGWLHAVVQPFATIVTRVLLWMKRTSGLTYGWVIIIFGVAVRLLLWPLNQSAMRTSIRMQRLQPELAEVQRKYKSDPKKQQEALVKLYQAHGMTPFSPMMGCLPMLLPMPILFALYFVFLNTIEFRGVSFLWMHDISAADPYYITPIVMGLSMFALSWIGMRGTPPTAQTRMMSYMMPVVLTFMFFRFAAGLNLYYAVQNLAAIPQQWLLARERAGAAASGGAAPPGRSKS